MFGQNRVAFGGQGRASAAQHQIDVSYRKGKLLLGLFCALLLVCAGAWCTISSLDPDFRGAGKVTRMLAMLHPFARAALLGASTLMFASFGYFAARLLVTGETITLSHHSISVPHFLGGRKEIKWQDVLGVEVEHGKKASDFIIKISGPDNIGWRKSLWPDLIALSPKHVNMSVEEVTAFLWKKRPDLYAF
jgi:hypothetical protein